MQRWWGWLVAALVAAVCCAAGCDQSDSGSKKVTDLGGQMKQSASGENGGDATSDN
jgi:hypothetical protein